MPACSAEEFPFKRPGSVAGVLEVTTHLLLLRSRSGWRVRGRLRFWLLEFLQRVKRVSSHGDGPVGLPVECREWNLWNLWRLEDGEWTGES